MSYFGGRGVGRSDGVVTFVPGTAPGDLARVRVVRRKAKLIEAELIAILEPSPHRRTPPCPVADRCGGCSWQHVTYAEQLRQKDLILRSSLRRLTPEWFPILPAPEEFDYRNRVQLQIDRGRWGFYAARSRRLVEFERCWIAAPAINAEKNRRRPADFPGVDKVEIALTETGEVRVMPGRRDPGAALFSQVNTRQNEALRGLVGDWISGSPSWFMDLYAGAGNFTDVLRAAAPAAHGLAVELSQASVARGRRRVPAVDWVADDVGRALARRTPSEGPGLVLVDPPRVGADRAVIAELARHRPTQIIYVSCNPTTFARDAELLVGGGEFVFERVRGLDMFPQTEHVELIASFRHRSAVIA